MEKLKEEVLLLLAVQAPPPRRHKTSARWYGTKFIVATD